jgi:hypothetical protein
MTRTTTTTREQTWNREDNYTLKMFTWHLYKLLHNLEFLAAYAYMRMIETQFVVKKLKTSDLKFVQSLKT